MRLNEIEKLNSGSYYEITVIEDNPKGFGDGVKNTYIAEYRGKDYEVDYYLFFIEDKNSMSIPYHYEDILSCKKR